MTIAQQERKEARRIAAALISRSEERHATLAGIFDHLIRNYQCEEIVETLAQCFGDWVTERIQPPNEPTPADCKRLAVADKLSWRLFQALTKD